MAVRTDPLVSSELLATDELAPAKWVASARLLLTMLSVAVVLLDRTVPRSGDSRAVFFAVLAAAMFLVVAGAIHAALSARWVAPAVVIVAGPFIDLALAGALILATDGYLSPFTLWIVFAVVETAYAGRSGLTTTVAALGASLHLLIALVPQAEPLDTSVLLVRVSYLAGFGLLVGSVGGVLARRNRELATIDRLGKRLQDASDLHSACRLTAESFREALRANRVEVEVGGMAASAGPEESGAPTASWENEPEVSIRLWRRRSCGSGEMASGRVMTDRLSGAVRRLSLTDRLVEGAAREERLRLADEVHDGYLQTLAAATMRLEAARQLAERDQEAAHEIEVVKQILRDGTNRARDFLRGQAAEEPPGPERLRRILQDRWRGPWDVHIDPEAGLSPGEWNVAEMVLREGVNNALTHGRATTAILNIAREGELVHVSLECDGEAPPRKVRFGFGLGRLSEVLGSHRASLELTVGPQGGSLLKATFGGRSV